MARGWESKSVEAQIDAAEMQRSSSLRKPVTEQDLELIRKRESLTLSRTRVMREIEGAKNPKYQAILKKALAGLDAQLAALGR